MHKRVFKKREIVILSSILILLLVIAMIFTQRYRQPKYVDFTALDTIIEPEVIREFGFAVDSFYIIHGTIKPNQHLGMLLEELNCSSENIKRVSLTSKDTFNLKSIRAGRPYIAFLSKDTASVLQHLVYEHSPVDYVIFDFKDSVKVSTGQKTVTTITKTFSGKIESSLWNALKSKNANPYLAIELSEVYAWVIDFFMLSKNDEIKVIYDELFVDTISLGIGKIHTALFKHYGKDYYAIPFTQDSILSFFDENGKSLKREFLKAPLKYSRISSRFSNSRMHPVLRIRRPHHGVDYAAPVGTPVHSVGQGVVTKKAYSGGAGHLVSIRHNSVYTTSYMHLSKYGKGIQQGARVQQGQIIGYVGSTGLSSGPHLDFRFYKNGKPVDPLKIESPPVEPVRKENMVVFDSITKEFISRLEAIKVSK